MTATAETTSNDTFTDEEERAQVNPLLSYRHNRIMEKYRGYIHETFDQLGAASEWQTQELMTWLGKTEMTEESIKDREDTWETHYVRMQESAHTLYHEGLMDSLLRAYNERPRCVSRENIREWSDRFKNRSVDYKKKEHFVQNELPKYISRWRAVAQKRHELLNNPRMEALKKSKKIKSEDLSEFLNEDKFLNAHYKRRLELVDAVKAALLSTAKGGDTEKLYDEAQSQLQKAVSANALSQGKVGTWLRRIFESGANPESIEKFIKGSSKTSLGSLIHNWTEVSKKYNELEKKRVEKGTPRSFHFVHKTIFLDWHYEKRKAYIEEADKRFKDISKTRDDFAQIRSALDMKDWEEADMLIKRAKVKPLKEEESMELRSMEKFLREHREPEEAKEGPKRVPSDKDVVGEMRELLMQVPPSQRQLHVEMLQRGAQAFRCLRVCWYNRVWCVQHGYLSPDKELEWKEHAEANTWKRIRHGHGNRMEANDIRDPTNVRGAIRDQQGGVNAPQLLIGNQHSHGALAQVMDEQKNNRQFWYWTSLIPEGVEYAEHKYVNQTIHPRMQKLAYEMEKRGITFTETGENVQYFRKGMATSLN